MYHPLEMWLQEPVHNGKCREETAHEHPYRVERDDPLDHFVGASPGLGLIWERTRWSGRKEESPRPAWLFIGRLPGLFGRRLGSAPTFGRRLGRWTSGLGTAAPGRSLKRFDADTGEVLDLLEQFDQLVHLNQPFLLVATSPAAWTSRELSRCPEEVYGVWNHSGRDLSVSAPLSG